MSAAVFVSVLGWFFVLSLLSFVSWRVVLVVRFGVFPRSLFLVGILLTMMTYDMFDISGAC